jgi:hypothetical protein
MGVRQQINIHKFSLMNKLIYINLDIYNLRTNLHTNHEELAVDVIRIRFSIRFVIVKVKLITRLTTVNIEI